jgi:hypothetical protein
MTSDFESIVSTAIAAAAAKYDQSKFCRAVGNAGDQGGQAASDFTSWRFHFWLSMNSQVLVLYDAGNLHAPELQDGGRLGEEPISIPLPISLDRAVTLLRAGGYGSAIQKIDLVKPLYGDTKEAEYQFAFGKDMNFIVAVGASTGSVKVEPLPTKDA